MRLRWLLTGSRAFLFGFPFEKVKHAGLSAVEECDDHATLDFWGGVHWAVGRSPRTLAENITLLSFSASFLIREPRNRWHSPVAPLLYMHCKAFEISILAGDVSETSLQKRKIRLLFPQAMLARPDRWLDGGEQPYVT